MDDATYKKRELDQAKLLEEVRELGNIREMYVRAWFEFACWVFGCLQPEAEELARRIGK